MADNFVPQFILDQYEHGRVEGQFLAATLFVDLSGYTPLTEALMRHEKDGAEALADALRSVFLPLINHVYARGGLIPLFAGDGFTAIFRCRVPNGNEADGHGGLSETIRVEDPPTQAAMHRAATQAAECALAIQRWLQGDGGSVHTKYGAFSMAATTGLSFGTVGWGTPGRGNARTFYFRGEAVDGCAAAENLAQDGEILADEKIASLLKGRYRIQAREDGLWLVSDVRRTSLPLRRHPLQNALLRARSAGQNRAASNLPMRADNAERPSSQNSKSSPCAPFIPEPILNLSVRAEFREVCVLFLSFQEPDDLNQMHDFLAEAMTLTRQFGGIVNQLDFGDMGGYLLLLFGAPIAHENDPERAAELLTVLREQNWSLPWRAGMDYGTVWTGMRGGDDRAEYGAAGNVVIMACRLFLKAPWHEIWVSKSVAAALGDQYVLDSLGDIPIKGRTMIQPVFRLLKSQRDVTQESLYPAGIVEREEELQQLSDWGVPLSSGSSPGLFLIHGEAGIGKSRLIREWRKRIEAQAPILWLTLPGDSTARRSLGPLRHAMQRYFTKRVDQPLTRDSQYNRRLFERMEDTLIESLVGFGPAVNEVIENLTRGSSFLASLLDIYWDNSLYEMVEPQLRFENLVSAFKALMVAESYLQPVVLQLEDLHLYDDESLQFLKGLTRNLSDRPIGFVGACRLQEDGSPTTAPVDEAVHVEQLSLAYLSQDGIRHYAARVLQGEISEAVVDLLLAKTNGNPFFVEQLALTLVEQGSIQPSELAEAGNPLTNRPASALAHYDVTREQADAIPATLNAVMTARLDRLDRSVKQVVQTAAVLGTKFEASLLSRMMPDVEDLFQQVRKAQYAQVWKPTDDGEHYQFQHALLRDAAYEMQMRSQLRQIHRQAAVAIQQQYMGNLRPHYGSLATHYDKAEQTQSAIHWYTLAGEEAIKNYANADAIRHITRGLDLTKTEQRDERVKLTKLRERVYDILGDRGNQERDIHTLQNLAAESGDALLQAELTINLGDFARVTNDYELAQTYYRDVVQQAAEQREPNIEIRGHYGVGRTLWQQGNYTKALTHLQKARSLAQLHSNAELEAQSLYDMGNVYYYESDYQTAQNTIQRAYALFRTLGDRRQEGNCLGMFGVLFKQQGDYLRAQDYYQKALTIFQSIGYRRGQSFILGYLGNNYFELGFYELADQYHRQALHQCREMADQEGQAVSLNTLGLVRLFQGDNDAARPFIEEALAIQRSIGHLRGEGYSLTYLGYIDTARKGYDSARIAHLEAIQLREKLNANALVIDNWAGLAEVALAESDFDGAVTYARNALDWLAAKGPTGIEFPIQVYLTCFRVLSQASQVDSTYLTLAQNALSQGEALLSERAKAILDEELRTQFYEAVPANRALQEAADRAANSEIEE